MSEGMDEMGRHIRFIDTHCHFDFPRSAGTSLTVLH